MPVVTFEYDDSGVWKAVDGNVLKFGDISGGGSVSYDMRVSSDIDLTGVGFALDLAPGYSEQYSKLLEWGASNAGVLIRQKVSGGGWGSWQSFRAGQGDNLFSKILLSRFTVIPVESEDGVLSAGAYAYFQLKITVPVGEDACHYIGQVGIYYD